MNLQFIGTSSGFTSLNRDHSSILIDTDISNILIDCGDGISKALIKNKISFDKINAIIFTHYHADHFSGIASLISQMKLIKRKKELSIFTHINLVEPLRQLLDACYMFEDTLGFDLKITGFDFNNEFIIDNLCSFTAKQNTHIKNKHNTKSVPEERFVSSSLLLTIDGKKLIYTSDVASREDLFLFDGVKPEIFITETTHIDLDWIHGIVTFYHPRQIYLTHIADYDEQKIVKYLRNQTFPHSVEISMADDGHSVTLF